MTQKVAITGGCHCGAVRFAARAQPEPEILVCNCSICRRTGYKHLIVKHQDFTLLSGKGDLKSYRFGTNAAEHLFCKICGIKSFYQPRSHPDSWSVHLDCLDDASLLRAKLRAFDGRNWEEAAQKL